MCLSCATWSRTTAKACSVSCCGRRPKTTRRTSGGPKSSCPPAQDAGKLDNPTSIIMPKKYLNCPNCFLCPQTGCMTARSIVTPPVFQLGDRLLRSHELLFLNRHDVSRLASRRTTKYCPFCLSSGLYHRLLWDLVPVTTCLTHSVLLIDHCPACNGRVTHEQICKGKHKCGYELSAAEGCPPPGGKEALGGQALVLALLRGEHFHPSGPYANPVFCLSSPQFFALFDILALLIVRASNRLEGLKAEGLETDRGVPRLGWRQKLTNRSHHALFLPALRILTGWPESFFTFLEDCRAKDADRVFARLLREHRPSQELTALKQGGLSFVYEAVREYLGPRGSVVPRVSDRPPKGAKRAGGAAREGRGAQQAEKA